MLAKLRAGSGSDSRSRLVITLWCTAVARSIACSVTDDPCACTEADCCTEAELSVTLTSRTVPTDTVTVAVAGENPVAVTRT